MTFPDPHHEYAAGLIAYTMRGIPFSLERRFEPCPRATEPAVALTPSLLSYSMDRNTRTMPCGICLLPTGKSADSVTTLAGNNGALEKQDALLDPVASTIYLSTWSSSS